MALTKVSYSMINGAPINILDMGAVGDGTTDCTAVIQAALDLNKTGFYPIYFPPGVYLVTDDLEFNSTNANPNFVASIKIIGGGVSGATNPDVVPYTGGTFIKTTKTTGTLLEFSGSSISGLTMIQISDIHFLGPDPMTITGPITSGDGLVFSTSNGYGTQLRIDNVIVSGFGRYGCYMQNVENSLISRLVCNYNGAGLTLIEATNANVFNYIECQENYNYGLDYRAGAGNTFSSPLIQGNKQTGLLMRGAESVIFTAPYFESNNYKQTAGCYDILIRNVGDGISFNNTITFTNTVINGQNGGVYVDSSGAAAYAIGNVVFDNCRSRNNDVPNVTFNGARFANCSITNSTGFSLLDTDCVVTTDSWRDWTPVIGNASGGIYVTKFRKRGNAYEYYIILNSYTVTANSYISVTPPVVTAYNSALAAFNATGQTAQAHYSASLGKITINTSASGPFTIGDVVTLEITGLVPVY
jgi:hypothetical protein